MEDIGSLEDTKKLWRNVKVALVIIVVLFFFAAGIIAVTQYYFEHLSYNVVVGAPTGNQPGVSQALNTDEQKAAFLQTLHSSSTTQQKTNAPTSAKSLQLNKNQNSAHVYISDQTKMDILTSLHR